jgi:thiol-disulfide isomerase/thioredoxin
MRATFFRLAGATALATLVTAGATVAEVRTWKSADGNFTVQAELLAVQDGSIRLRKDDGTELTVPLAKLSTADRQFAKENAPSAAAQSPAGEAKAESKQTAKPSALKPAATSAAADAIRDIAEKFYADLRTKERESAAGLLTAEAQKLAQDSKSFLPSLPTPDAEARALTVGKPKVVGKQAEVPVQVRVDGKPQKTILHLRSEDGAWRVFALSAALGKDEKTINFETPRSTAGKEDSLAALVGQKLELDGVTLDGRRLNMADYQGKVVLIDFWATWCGPCREEIPNILANWTKYHDSGFEVIAISVDKDLDALQKFVLAERPPWTVIADQHPSNGNPMGRKYRITSIPTFALLGPDGKVAALNCRGERLGPAIASLLAAKK